MLSMFTNIRNAGGDTEQGLEEGVVGTGTEEVVRSFVGHGTDLRFIFRESLKNIWKMNVAKLQNITDIFFIGQWFFHPEVIWSYMAIH